MREHLADADREDDDVQREIDGDDHHGEPDRFLKPFRKTAPSAASSTSVTATG